MCKLAVSHMPTKGPMLLMNVSNITNPALTSLGRTSAMKTLVVMIARVMPEKILEMYNVYN